MSLSNITTHAVQTDLLQNNRKIYLQEGRSLQVEPGALLALHNLEMKTKAKGSILDISKRVLFGGESIFLNEFTAKDGGGWFVPEEPIKNQIQEHWLQPGETFYLSRGAFVAADSEVKLKPQYAGITGYLKGLGIGSIKATLKCDQPKRLFLNSPGGIVQTIHLKENMGTVVVDNNCLIAYSGNLKCLIEKIGGYKSLMFSGEGFVNKFQGDGVLYVGSGIVTNQKNLLKTLVEILVPDSVTLVNRIIFVACMVIAGSSPNLLRLGEAMHKIGEKLQRKVHVHDKCSYIM